MTSLRFALLPLVLLAAPVLAETATPPANAATDATAPEKKVCRSVSGTGSYMRKRVCHTRAEWAELERAASSSTDQTLQRRRNNGGVDSY